MCKLHVSKWCEDKSYVGKFCVCVCEQVVCQLCVARVCVCACGQVVCCVCVCVLE